MAVPSSPPPVTVGPSIAVFEDYDDQRVYERIGKSLVSNSTKNFVVDFGEDGASVTLDLSADAFKALLGQNNPPRETTEKPVRWINLWAPNRQVDSVNIISSHYGLSRRLQAILQSKPDAPKTSTVVEGRISHGKQIARQSRDRPRSARRIPGEDVEHGMNGNIKPSSKPPRKAEETSHYDIAARLINYQSFDLSERTMCIGNNWIYHVAQPGAKDEKSKMVDKRLWSWLILYTVISIHEDPMVESTSGDVEFIRAIRAHPIRVLSQLSLHGFKPAGAIAMTSVRQALSQPEFYDKAGFEGSSNLFYYLFDSWHETLRLIIRMQLELETIETTILSEIDSTHQGSKSKNTVIRDLYQIGKGLRSNQRLYEGYKNLITRVLDFKTTSGTSDHPQTPSTTRVHIAQSASERFKRLEDRIDLLVLGPLSEAVAEKQALLDTYFNITTQKDYEATAKLSRNTALLSRLGVLFLPVSLMTGYFSVQIDDLQGVYTARTYWVAFAIIMSLSFVAVFFMSRLIMRITESLDTRMNRLSTWCAGLFTNVKESDEDEVELDGFEGKTGRR